MRPPVYLDECVDLHVASLVQRYGFHVITARDVGMLGVRDDEQLAYATTHQLLLVSHDTGDFRRIHLRLQQHGGMILVPYGPVHRLALRIALAIDWIAGQGEHRNRLVRWHDIQRALIAGDRVSGYTEEEIRSALGRLP